MENESLHSVSSELVTLTIDCEICGRIVVMRTDHSGFFLCSQCIREIADSPVDLVGGNR